MNNNKNPPVFYEHIISVGLCVKLVSNEYVVVDKNDKYICKFDDVEWGYGASGMLCCNHVPIHCGPVQLAKVEEIRKKKL